jgi:chloramphenicol 3-O-phosphotransferase
VIIFIAGTSSAGKSTLCHALQQKLGPGWLNFSTDNYLSMLGPEFLALHPDNSEVCVPNDVCYAKKHPDGTYEIIPGPLCSKLYATIPQTLQCLAMQGFNLIVDSFITTKDELHNYKNIFKNDMPIFIYLLASEEVITQRESKRGDRLKGSALHWLKAFDYQDDCDLVLNTEEVNMDKACEMILMLLK